MWDDHVVHSLQGLSVGDFQEGVLVVVRCLLWVSALELRDTVGILWIGLEGALVWETCDRLGWDDNATE